MIKRAYWDQDRLAEYQTKRLRKIIRYAYDSVHYYHNEFERLGIRPSDVKTEKDLNKLPIIRKGEIRENLEQMISKDFDVSRLKMLSTSWSTGEPLLLYVTGAESEFRKAKHLRANISCGQKLRDRWVVITAPHHFGEATRLQQMLGFYAPTPISVFTDISTQILTLQKLKPDVLDGYSSSLLILAKELEKREVGPIRPRLIIGGAELIDDHSRHFVEEVLNAPFYDQYSSVELERMAWQCPAHQEYHMDSDAIIMQFVDKNGNEVSPGERGEIICTSLFNYAMPFIRYAIGDMGIPSDGFCTCGRTLPLMKVVEGRRDSLLLLPNGRMLTPRTFTIAMNRFQFYQHIDQFRIVQKKPDLFRFSIKMKDVSREERVIEAELVAHFKRTFTPDLNEVEFDIEFVEEIPLDKSGKLMAVVSELKSDDFLK